MDFIHTWVLVHLQYLVNLNYLNCLLKVHNHMVMQRCAYACICATHVVCKYILTGSSPYKYTSIQVHSVAHAHAHTRTCTHPYTSDAHIVACTYTLTYSLTHIHMPITTHVHMCTHERTYWQVHTYTHT